MLELTVILMMTGAVLIAVRESKRSVSLRREKTRPWWEAAPFPLDNADRIYNWRLRAIEYHGGLASKNEVGGSLKSRLHDES